ncbi:XRE family transcriptional regulator [Halalkalibacterium halodurans]|uniref:helix-turn-helix domain-containing protein n=1 Tax=Halalkalibacterium halodurans TaxID=86665 RepID=UPI0010673EF7|nr:helix-turn-helix transcriptional regulator [Halalkalibacterium halodurans]TES56156.1 XRE family transcriptional regulator [Halalkalibacterium halodurans]
MANIIGKRLQMLREKEGWTKSLVAKKLNIKTVSTYANWEYGLRQPDNEMLVKIANLFDVTTDYLLGRTDNPQGSINIHYDGGNGLELEDEDEEIFLKEQLEQYRKMKERMKKRLQQDEKK